MTLLNRGLRLTSRANHMITKTPGRIVLLMIVCAVSAASAYGQKRATFTGNWNWAIYGTSKEDLPPAYRDMDLKEVPSYAVDLTLKQKGQRLSGSFGILAHYLARVDEGSFSATINGNRATIKVRSNFGGSATVVLTLNGDKLQWKTIRSTDQNYF